jgi:hypothetical protein
VVRLEHENANATLFGVPIRLGPTRIQVDRAQVIQLSATMKKFTNAKMGTAVPIRLRPLVPVRFELVELCGSVATPLVRFPLGPAF